MILDILKVIAIGLLLILGGWAVVIALGVLVLNAAGAAFNIAAAVIFGFAVLGLILAVVSVARLFV